jgi:predicted nucleic acid-binding protein
LDALHLAIAFSYEISLITADEGLAASAKILGVPVQILRL